MMTQKLQELVDRLKKAHADRLVSVILYGSAVTGDHHQRYSDLNVLCVLKEVSPAALEASEPVLNWWRAQGNPSPLLLTEDEVRTSTDCFPIEFHDLVERRRVLYGPDVIEGLVIDDKFYRAQIEQELRAKFLRLRQKAGGVLTDKKALLQLMIDSAPNFLVLTRHALLFAGIPTGSPKRDITRNLASIGVDPQPFDTLLDLREQSKTAGDVDPGTLFASYLKQIQAVVQYVDGLEK
jgi:predicted nucleotidyltransferase